MKKSLAIASVAFMAMLVCFTQLSALTLFSDNFDDNNAGISGWKRGSTTYITRYTGAYKVGDASMQILGGYTAEVDIKTPIFKNMVLKFKMAAVDFEATDKLYCEYCVSGTTWVVAATLSDGSDNGAFISYSVNVPNCSILKIRFRQAADSTTDYGYVDDVILTGDRW